ncbi:MAG: ABC transporter permease [Myxococcales bacterium]|nr:ABC transporter permease [Myxococcales bacterium]MCB9372624.1 ABC transporter permease [Microthrixaceae bacterium]
MSGLDPLSAGVALEDVDEIEADEELAPKPLRADVWRRFRQNKLALVGLGFIVLLILVAVFAPWIAPYGPAERSPGAFREPPSLEHWFGTDTIGLDVFSRVVYGARISLRVGIIATLMTVVIGLVLGAVAGFYGGKTDGLIMRVTDVFLAIPYIVLAVAIATLFGKSVNSVILVLGLTGWLGLCRIVRASFLSLNRLEYVEAARSLGFRNSRIIFRHMLPNALQPVIVYATIEVGTIILAEAALSFLGVGPVPPTPAWGLMVSEAKSTLAVAPHMLFFPGMAIFLTVLAFVFVGDGLRDALDPKLK